MANNYPNQSGSRSHHVEAPGWPQVSYSLSSVLRPAPILLYDKYMESKRKNLFILTAVSPWIILGALAVLFPIFAFMTFQSIDRHRSNSERMLMEKGAALIRSFEAGTRTGMMGMRWGGKQLQNLLTETAKLPDIRYIFVTDADGRVLAHNDLEMVGRQLETDLDLETVARRSLPRYREVMLPDGEPVFEVFRRFSPASPPPGPGLMRMMQRTRPPIENPEIAAETPLQLIFIGLDISAVESARKSDALHSITMGVILLLIGFAGVFLLFVLQSYRTTRDSLSRVQAFSDTLVKNMPIGLVAVGKSGDITFANQVAENILRFRSKKIIGRPAGHRLPDALWRVVADAGRRKAMVEREVECRVGDQMLPLEAGANPLLDESGGFSGIVLLFKDLSEIRGLRKEVARTQRLASIGSLAAGVAHEIRNPLSSVKGFATYFKERYGDNTEDRQVADIMIQEVDRLNRVVGQLLEFAKPVDIRKETVSAEEFLKNSLKLLETRAEARSITLKTRISENVSRVFIDPGRIRQVLLNLGLNAVEAMNDGGEILVSLEPADDPNAVRIRVVDNGPGIDAAALPQIFDPYYTTKPSGTGLGLAMAHNMIEAHGGDIRIESNPGKETVVTVTLQDARP
jgi:two-component system, NtrC family, sensor histidine kinase HydH